MMLLFNEYADFAKIQILWFYGDQKKLGFKNMKLKFIFKFLFFKNL